MWYEVNLGNTLQRSTQTHELLTNEQGAMCNELWWLNPNAASHLIFSIGQRHISYAVDNYELKHIKLPKIRSSEQIISLCEMLCSIDKQQMTISSWKYA